MKWFIATCDKSIEIIKSQMFLFQKYAPDVDFKYITTGSESLSKWGETLAMQLPKDEHIVFGLDDYLPIDSLKKDLFEEACEIVKKHGLSRFELGWGASDKGKWIKKQDQEFIDMGEWLLYQTNTPYTVSCQFSIWKTDDLSAKLIEGKTPWLFETNTKLSKAACFKREKAVFRWIEESALSERKKGKVNVLGLRHADVDSLVENCALKREDLIYGWKGSSVFNIENAGIKYQEFYG